MEAKAILSKKRGFICGLKLGPQSIRIINIRIHLVDILPVIAYLPLLPTKTVHTTHHSHLTFSTQVKFLDSRWLQRRFPSQARHQRRQILSSLPVHVTSESEETSVQPRMYPVSFVGQSTSESSVSVLYFTSVLRYHLPSTSSPRLFPRMRL